MKVSLGILVGVLAGAMFLGTGHASAQDCGINTGDPHAYAGLQVVSKWVGDDGRTNVSNNNTVTVSEHGSGASDSIGGNIVIMSKVQEYFVPGARFKSQTFKQIGGCGPSMVVLAGDGGNASPAVGSGISDWGLDCDTSKLGPGIYQRFDITGNGVPAGARAWPNGTSNQHWSVFVTASSGPNAAPNGLTLYATIWYTQPPKQPPPTPTPTPTSTGLSCSAITYNAGTVVVGRRSYDIQADIYLSGATPFGTNYLVNHINNNSPADGDHSTNIIPTSQSITMSVVEFYVQGGRIHYVLGSFSGSTPNPVQIASAGPCYSADCSMSIDSGLPNNDVVPGQPFTVTATINNDSVVWPGIGKPQPIPNTLDGGTVQFQNNGGSSNFAYGLTNNAGPGFAIGFDGTTIQFTATVSGPGSVVGQLAAAGKYFIGSACSVPVNIYQAPVVTAGAACQSDISGVAYDPYIPGFPVYVEIYADGPRGGGGTRIDDGTLESSGPGTTYSLAVPSAYQDGQNHTFYVYGDDPYHIQDGGPATATMTGCEAFHIQPGANGGSLSPSVEAPTSFDGTATVTVTYGPNGNSWYGPDLSGTNQHRFDSFPGVPASVTYTYTKNGAVISGPGFVPSPTGNGRFNNTSYSTPAVSIAAGSYQAGDTYCLAVGGNPIDGFIQNDGTLLSVTNAGPDTQTSCDTVKNRPFFKAFDSGISAGGSFKAVDASCKGGGELAGWNNDTGTYPSATSGDFGASSQLNALALTNIVGFGSGQSNGGFGSSPTNLTFANTDSSNITGDAYSPKLGGAFDPAGGGYCLNDQTVPTGGDVTSPAGPYPLDNGGTLTIPKSDNKSIFVTGDVYIANNVVYDTSGWSYAVGNSNIPSLVLHATGNIYISNNVRELDGLYIAQKEIYTCSDDVDGQDYQPMPHGGVGIPHDVFHDCNNPLTVNGSFVASQVDMMRSYGSLRDETPVGGGGAGSQLGLVWSCGGSICNPSTAGLSCISMNVTGEPPSHTWTDNQLCAPSSVQLNWSLTTSPNTLAKAKANSGLPYCTNWNVNNVGEGAYWDDDWLCSNKDLTFSYSGPIAGKYCTYINEPADPDAGNLWNSNKTYLCEPLAAAATPSPPASLTCSNAPAGDTDGTNGGRNIEATCAAEVFQLSPELYLSTPNVAQPNNGAPEWDAVTSLPPVL